MTTKSKTIPTTPANDNNKHAIETQLAEIDTQRRDLEARLHRVRGTRDLPGPVVAPAATLTSRIEALVRDKPRTILELTRELHESAGAIVRAMKDLRTRLYNLGTDVEPRWFYVVTDNAPTVELNAAVRALITDRPMSFQELLAATGARMGRVSGAIVALQREGARITNLGTPARGRWFLIPDGVQIAKLRSR